MNKKSTTYFRLVLLLFVGLNTAGMYNFHKSGQEWFDLSSSLIVADLVGWVLLVLIGIFFLYIGVAQADRIVTLIKMEFSGPLWLRLPAFLMFIILILIYPVLMFSEYSRYVLVDWTRQVIFVWLVLFSSLALAVWQRKTWVAMVPFSAALLAVSYHFATYLPDVSTYPFSLAWSETTRYYVSSTLFDHKIYSLELPLPFRDFTRYLMQAVPFLVKDSPLWVHRLWQAVLRFSSTYFAGYLLARHYKIKQIGWIALFTMWAGLYFFQGPIFYNLMVNVILVFWLVKPDRFLRTLVAVAAISLWAGLSRVNWIPMPGLMAAVFYLLEKPIEGKDFGAVCQYLWKPVTFVIVGTLVGMAVYQGYALVSGNPEEIYYSSFSSYLLWDRLLPNPTFSMGILPYVLILTAPLLIYLGLAWGGWKKQWHFIRPLAVAGIAGGLFAGGLLVSVKIGGGTNLHNMDVYFVILLLIAAEVFFSRVVDSEGKPFVFKTPLFLKSVIFVMPILFVISYSGGVLPERDVVQAQNEIEILQKYVDQAVEDGGEVLFISQRHLITFGYIENVSLVHDHEKLLLQEMAMSRNISYLENFGSELAEHRYALIVHDPIPVKEKDEEKEPLAAENNVIFRSISPLFTCAYKEAARLLDGKLTLFVPANMVTCGNIEE